MMKAYDRVEWNYLEGCLLKLGFSPSWTSTVMRCVTSVRYAVRVNGELTDPVVPTRGIRQGDPISPYLFLLCTEGLSCLLQQREAQGELQGIRNGRLGPPISHLLFADDSIFFSRSDRRSVDALHNTLEVYCEGSGQKINKDKSAVFFGAHCSNVVKPEVMQKLEIHTEALKESYLGMPTEIGRSQVGTFRYLLDRMWKRVNGCSDRPMSRAGKETFLKSVVQAIPTYVMSCFRLPVASGEEMRKSIANHWWGVENGRKKLHWRSWEWLSTPKALGGLGFRDMELFNQAMLARQGWRLLTDPTSLCARVLKGRYFHDCSFWNASKPRSASYTWRSILFGRDLLKQGVRWGIGNGKMTNILHDSWIPGVLPSMLHPLVPLSDDQTVDSLILDDSRAWNVDMVQAIFPEDVAMKVLQVPISRHGGEDFASWPHTRFGQYTVRSGYNLARSSRFCDQRSRSKRGLSSDTIGNCKLWKSLWSTKAPGKMKITVWRFAHDCLPSGHNLRVRRIPASPNCIFCGRHEAIEHTLLFCPFAREVWEAVSAEYQINLRRKFFTSTRTWVLDFFHRCSAMEATTLTVTLWHIWDARNKVREGEALMHHDQLLEKSWHILR